MAKKLYSKLKQKSNYAIKDIYGFFGLNRKLFRQAKGARIVVYHGVCQSNHTRFNSIFLKIKTFERHLQYYKKYFHVVSLNDYYQERFSKDRFNICITFDDGFANNYKYVLPLMVEYRVPVAFFITGIRDAGYDILWNDFLAIAQKYGPKECQLSNEIFLKNRHGFYVSKRGKLLRDLLREENFEKKAQMMKLLESSFPREVMMREEDYWMQMTQKEIKILSESSFATIGSHGYYHNDLSGIPVNKAKEEMFNAKLFLENTLQKEVKALAFPYGSYSHEVINAAKSVGFNQLLATKFLFSEGFSDPCMRERFIVNPYISVNNQMIATINGNYK